MGTAKNLLSWDRQPETEADNIRSLVSNIWNTYFATFLQVFVSSFVIMNLTWKGKRSLWKKGYFEQMYSTKCILVDLPNFPNCLFIQLIFKPTLFFKNSWPRLSISYCLYWYSYCHWKHIKRSGRAYTTG